MARDNIHHSFNFFVSVKHVLSGRIEIVRVSDFKDKFNIRTFGRHKIYELNNSNLVHILNYNGKLYFSLYDIAIHFFVIVFNLNTNLSGIWYIVNEQNLEARAERLRTAKKQKNYNETFLSKKSSRLEPPTPAPRNRRTLSCTTPSSSSRAIRAAKRVRRYNTIDVAPLVYIDLTGKEE